MPTPLRSFSFFSLVKLWISNRSFACFFFFQLQVCITNPFWKAVATKKSFDISTILLRLHWFYFPQRKDFLLSFKMILFPTNEKHREISKTKSKRTTSISTYFHFAFPWSFSILVANWTCVFENDGKKVVFVKMNFHYASILQKWFVQKIFDFFKKIRQKTENSEK